MSFPTTSLIDTFNRANEGPPPSASWTSDIFNDASAGLKVVSNQCVGNAAGSSNGWWNVETFGPDCEVYCDVPTEPDGTNFIELYLRLQTPGTAGIDGYYLTVIKNAGADIWQIWRVDNGAFTQLGANFTQEIASGEKIGFSAIGSVLTAYHYTGGAWSTIDSRTDSTYAGAGYIGLGCGGTVVNLDNFAGGTYAIATSSGRTITASMQTAIASDSATLFHFLEFQFSGGTVYICTAPHDVSWDSHTWQGVGGNLAFDAVGETPDLSANGVSITLSGVDQTILNDLLGQYYVGRLFKAWMAHVDGTGAIIADPLLLFSGKMNGGFEVEEAQEEFGPGTVTIKGDMVDRLVDLENHAGIKMNLESHQAVFSGDLFFEFTATLIGMSLNWGKYGKNK